jgi:gluconate 2-dehydrogenase gamma chain
MKRYNKRLAEQTGLHAWLAQWHGQLVTRRRFLVQLAGGVAAALFPWSSGTAGIKAATLGKAARWQVIDAVQQHMFPSEPDSPGAREIKALDYLKFIVSDASLDAAERAFILQGAGWLDDMAQQLKKSSFSALDEESREQVLRNIEKSEAGSNWLSLILLYLIEALLADPAYGSNPDGVGWRWLSHIPGFPSPPPGKRYMELLKR